MYKKRSCGALAVSSLVVITLLIYAIYDRGARHLALPNAGTTTKRHRVESFGDILYGLQMYESACARQLPDAIQRDPFGRPCYSWRVAVYCFLEQSVEPFERDVPWFDPRNYARNREPNRYFCFLDDDTSPESFHTQVWAVTGLGTAFERGKVNRSSGLPRDLILLVEAGQSKVHWMALGDLDTADVPDWLPSGTVGDGLTVAFADGEAWFLDPSVKIADLDKFFTIESAARYDRETILGPYRQLRYHTLRGFW